MSLLGVALAAGGDLTEGERLLREGYEGMPAVHADGKRAALRRLVKHFETRGDTAAAARWRSLLDGAAGTGTGK